MSEWRGRGSKPSLWAYYLFYVVVTLLSLVAITWYAMRAFRSFFIDHLSAELQARAAVIAAYAPRTLRPAVSSDICRTEADELGLVVQIVTRAGDSLCTQGRVTSTFMLLTEVKDALDGGRSSIVRRGKEERIFVAAPLLEGEEIWGVVHLTLPLTNVDSRLRSIFLDLLVVEILITFFVGVVSLLFYRQIDPPLQEMRQGAERFARGLFDRKLPQYRIGEIDALASSMNTMGAQLKHLEKVRRDFVANVSHELKTPITSIQGFVETLLEGAIEDKSDARRFLRIVSKQSERLIAIIDDLLTLSRLESERANELITLQKHTVESLINSATEICRPAAEQKGIVVTIVCKAGLTVRIDRSLMEQALTNLVENAIKYSDNGTKVRVIGSETANEVSLSVADQGPGIPEQHVGRVFERFYRVDKARSRKLGGTGLGLAIVKHVASVHGGRVSVESRVGEGSTFAIHLPRIDESTADE